MLTDHIRFKFEFNLATFQLEPRRSQAVVRKLTHRTSAICVVTNVDLIIALLNKSSHHSYYNCLFRIANPNQVYYRVLLRTPESKHRVRSTLSWCFNVTSEDRREGSRRWFDHRLMSEYLRQELPRNVSTSISAVRFVWSRRFCRQWEGMLFWALSARLLRYVSYKACLT